MAEQVNGAEFFHLNQNVPYNLYPPMKHGQIIRVGETTNPFFSFYENEKYVSAPNGGNDIRIPAMRFLSMLKNGQASCLNSNEIAFDIAKHFQMLSRELILEEVRREIAPILPSRRRCMWLVPSIELASKWLFELTSSISICRLSVTGTVHRCDASFISRESEPISHMFSKAHRYWKGDTNDAEGQPEVLFEGVATVIETLPLKVTSSS